MLLVCFDSMLESNDMQCTVCLEILKRVMCALDLDRLPCSSVTLALLGSYQMQSEMGDAVYDAAAAAAAAAEPDVPMPVLDLARAQEEYLEQTPFVKEQPTDLVHTIRQLHIQHRYARLPSSLCQLRRTAAIYHTRIDSGTVQQANGFSTGLPPHALIISF